MWTLDSKSIACPQYWKTSKVTFQFNSINKATFTSSNFIISLFSSLIEEKELWYNALQK